MLSLKIKTDNAAFEGGCLSMEAARLLRFAADDIETGSAAGTLMDANGNKVGSWTLR